MKTKVSDYRTEITRSGGVDYRHFHSLYLGTSGKGVSVEIYKYIISRFFRKLSKLIIDEGLIFDMPYGLGRLYLIISEVKAKFDHEGDLDNQRTSYLIDHKKTKEAKERGVMGVIYDMTMSHKYKVIWSKGLFRNRSLFFFKPDKEIGKYLYTKSKEYTINI